MTTYTTVVGGTLIQPATIGYIAIPLTSDIQLSWPTDFQNANNSVAAVTFVTPDADAWSVTLPDATKTSVGNVFTIHNASDDFSFILKNKLGDTLSTLAPGDFYTFLLTANTYLGNPDPGGTWVPVTTSTLVSGISEIEFDSDTEGNIIFTPENYMGGILTVELGEDLLGLTSFDAETGVPTRTAPGAWNMTQKYIKYDGVATTVDAFAAFSGNDGEIGGGNPGPTLYNGTGIKISDITIDVNTIASTNVIDGMVITSAADVNITASTGTVSINSTAGAYITINNALGLKGDAIVSTGTGNNLEIISDENLILEGSNSQVISKSDLRLKSDGLIPRYLVIENGAGNEIVSIGAPIINLGQSYTLNLPDESYTAGDPASNSIMTVDNTTGNMSFVSDYPTIKLATATLQIGNIEDMYATPYQIIEGIAGKVIVPISWNLYLSITDGNLLTGGGSVYLLYADNIVPVNDGIYGISNNIGAGVITSNENTYSTSAMNSPQQGFTVGGGAHPVDGKGVYISNDAAPFDNGVSQTLTVKVLYTVIDTPI